MNQNTINELCVSCGGTLKQLNKVTYRCESCGQEYYHSPERKHRINIHLKLSKAIAVAVTCFIVIIVGILFAYRWYTSQLVYQSGRFSVPFREFLIEAYDKEILSIEDADLAAMKYLKISRADGIYTFTYSFEDYYDYENKETFEETLKTFSIQSKKTEFSPSNVQYLTGLTRLELCTEAWQNYKLPKENVLRYIYCENGYSKYGNATFFDNINPDTLEEICIYNAEELTDFSFMKNLQGVKSFTLEGAILNSGDMFEGFDRLEHISLKYVEMKEEDALEIVNTLLALPSLNSLSMEGRSAWYITDEQWTGLQKQYGNRVTITRQ